MNFGFTEEQDLLRAEVRKFLNEKAPLEEVRKQCESEEGFDRGLWKQMAELGFAGLTIPEIHGGAGLDLVTLLVVLEETGRSLFPSPLLSNVVASQAIQRFGSEAQQARWLPGFADGTRLGTLALLEEGDDLSPDGVKLQAKKDGEEIILTGRKLFVPDAGNADVFVVAYRLSSGAEEVGLALVEKGSAGVSAADFAAMDLTKRVGSLELNDVRVPSDQLLCEGGPAWSAIQSLVELGAALVTAETVGAAEGALAITTSFAKEREQFGSKIGRYQGVKHPLAEIYVDIESYKSLVYYAFWALDEGHDDAALAISRAKAYASETFPLAGINGVQLHGGVGYTWEYDIQLYLKRGKWMRPIYGDADYHYDRIAQLGGL
ncbi:MAG: acyl-CoA/acyl-ACP dehydrogenase [Myxococcota bacterium]|jgi:alkylation response protein AidB-like acyl-CoA dehydrogenase|nr:acyl-CoA/acyl-ACP dehydrogenase [Myxococcota bacterium]